MVFRLPTHLDNFIPPPSTQVQSQLGRPWRGILTVRGMRASDPGGNQEIRVTAVETDGDSQVAGWPTQFFAHLVHGSPILREARAWIHQHAPPIATFMPDRIADPDANVVNQTTFRSLSRILFENQIVAIAGWGSSSTFPGGGVIIIPAEHSSALLVAALFFEQFPDALASRLPPTSTSLVTHAPHMQPHIPSFMSPQPMQPISQYSVSPPLSAGPRPGYGMVHSAPNVSYQRLGSPSPVEQPIRRSRQEHHLRLQLPTSPIQPPSSSLSSFETQDDAGAQSPHFLAYQSNSTTPHYNRHHHYPRPE